MTVDISVLVPVYNEEANILPVQHNIVTSLQRAKAKYEIIYVDDGSTDNTFSELRKIHSKSRHTKVIRLSKNLGKTMALKAALDNAEGGSIVTLDGDLQNDANDIPLLLQKLDEGFQVVSGWRYSRKDAFIGKKLPSKISNFIARFLTGVKLHDFTCPLKAYTSRAIRSVTFYGDIHRYLPALIAQHGYKVAEVKVRHYKRRFGKSKYGAARFIKGPLDLLYLKFWANYSARPLHFFGSIGLMSILFGSVVAFLNISYHIYRQQTIFISVGPLLLLAILLILVGAQFIAMGFISEILATSYYSSQGKQAYKIDTLLKKK